MAKVKRATQIDGVLQEYLASPGLVLALVGVEAMGRLRRTLADQGLTPRQFQLLGLLHDRGPMGQQELGSEIGVAPSLLVTMLNPLETSGYARRKRDSRDRRRHVVVLTDEGAEHLADAAAAQRATEAALFDTLNVAQRETLSSLLALVRDGLTGGTTDHDATVGGSDALERGALLVADADRRRATRPADPGGLI